MRTKEVKISQEGGGAYVIAPLTVDQSYELVFTEEVSAAAKLVNEGGEDANAVAIKTVSGTRDWLRTRCAPIVAASLNNVTMGDGEWFTRAGEERWADPRKVKTLYRANKTPVASAVVVEEEAPPEDDSPRWWTPQMVSARLDWSEVSELYAKISEFTGFKSRVETKAASEVFAGRGESKAAGDLSSTSSAA